LDDRFRLLTGGSRTALPRQQTLRALIDWSWDLLSDSERAVLRRLSVFLSGWTLEAAEAVVSSDEIDERAVLELLTRLIEKSLVMLEEQGAETRYSLLETIRQYARDKLWESGEAKAVRDRHTRYFAGLSILAEPNLRRADQLTWLARLEREHDNLRAALKWSLGQEDEETALYLAGNLSRFWYLRGYWNEGRDWLRQALALAPVTPDTSESLVRARVMALCGAGWLADDDGSEVPLYTESLELSRRIGDRWHEAFSLRGMVAGISNWGNPEHVWPRLQESQALFEELQDQWGLALVRYNLGWMEFNRDNGKQAEAMWAQAHEWFRQSGDRWGIAVAISALGYTARLRGDYSRAVALNKESLALFRELGDKAGIAVSLVRLGNVALRRGEYTEAIALLEESIALQRERGDQSGLVSSLYLLGMVFTYQGDYARALATMEASLALARQLNDEYLIPYALTYLASTVYYAGDVQRAATLWQESLDRQAEEGERDVIGHSLLGLGLVAVHQGDLALAGQRLEKSLSVMKAVGDRRAIAIALHSLGRLALAQGDAARARQVFKESLVLRKKTGARRGIAETLESIAGAVEHPDRAARLFGSAAALREVIGAPVPLVERDDYDRRVAAARAQMGESAFAGAWAEGRAMTLEDAIALALSDEW
jgi:predicted ATPase